MRTSVIIFISLLYAIQAYGQVNTIKPQVWKFMSYSGSVSLNGQYNTSFTGTDFKSNDYTYGGGVFLATQSYVWHPNFLTLSVSGGYQPQTGEFTSSASPDYFRSLSSKNYNIYANFFKNLNYKLNAYVIHNEQKGEDRLFDRDITSKKWGADFANAGSYDVKVHFEHKNNHEFNNLTNNELLLANTSLRTKVKKSYFKSDLNELNINLQKNTSQQKDLYKNSITSAYINYRNSLFLDKKQTIPLNSGLLYSIYDGTSKYTSVGISQALGIPLFKKLKFNSRYSINNTKRLTELTKDTKFNSSLAYNLYRSLNTSLSFGYGNTDRTNGYRLESNIFGFNSSYSKKIPRIHGGISISYNLTKQQLSNEVEDNMLSVYNEIQILEDGDITLLNNVNILIETVVVKDVTGTLFFQENIDYILIERGGQIEIQRLFGGEIANNMTVYIDYEVFNNTSYAYNSEAGEFRIGIDFFDRFLKLEYINSYRNFTINKGSLENLGLDKGRNHTYNALLKYKKFNAGVSYYDFNSIGFPYKLISYNFNTRGKINKKINYQLAAIINNYTKYYIEGRTNKLTTISSDFTYNLNYNTRVNLNLSFSQQKGDVQNYSLISGRSQISTRFNQLEISLGFNYFNRSLPIQDFSSHYLGSFLKLTRNF